MCTVSWLHTPGGYELFFNRDERFSREPETPPRLMKTRAVRYLAPGDGRSGGTWIAVNESGVAASLLNGANLSPCDEGTSGTGRVSRGTLIPHAISALSAREVCARATSLDLTVFAPFTLLAVDSEAAAAVEWDGARALVLELEDGCAPLISSSFQPAAVRLARRADFAYQLRQHGINRTALLAFHASHSPEAGPFSTCMHRNDARTVSFTTVAANAGKVRLSWFNGSPCDQSTARRSAASLQFST